MYMGELSAHVLLEMLVTSAHSNKLGHTVYYSMPFGTHADPGCISLYTASSLYNTGR